MQEKVLNIKEVILTVIIAIICGILYRLWTPVYDLADLITGFSGQFVYGFWFIASIIAAYIIRKPGVAFLAEMAASSGELLAGSSYGLTTLFSGALQGLGAEAVLMAVRYRRWDLPVLMGMSVAATAGSFIVDYAFWGYAEKTVFIQTMSILLRTVGSLFVCGLLGKMIVDLVAKTGVLNSYAIIQSQQKPQWEK